MNGRLGTGQILGKYQIIAELGRGGMGVVYSAEDTTLGRVVALKVLPRVLMSDGAFLKRFREEAQVIASLSHPNVVHVHSFDIIDDLPVIEMEFIEGGALSRKLQREFVSKSDIVHYAYGIASALSFCHAMNSIHRDVKPSNILIDKLNNARLADFGIAKVLLDLEHSTFASSASGSFQGTPLYAPPEAWEGEAPTSAWDIYGLGAVMFQGLTGTPPYEANTPLQLVKKIATGAVPQVQSLNPSVSHELAQLIDDMLRSDCSQRLSDAEEVKGRLQKSPEFESDISNTRTHVPVGPKILRRNGKTSTRYGNHGKRWSRYLVGAITFLLVGALVMGIFFDNVQEFLRTAPDIPTAADAKTLSSTNLSTSTIPVHDLLHISKGVLGDNYAVLQTEYYVPSGRAPELWLVGLTGTGEPSKILTIGEASMASLQLSLSSADRNEYLVKGDWAGYLDSTASVLRYGVVSGKLRWKASSRELFGGLAFTSEQDGLTVDTTLAAITHPTLRTDTQFLLELERSDYVQPLLLNELIPRQQPWAMELFTLFPAFDRGMVRAPSLGQHDERIVIDGTLNESIWGCFTDARVEPDRVLESLPNSASSLMAFAQADNTLYIGITLNDVRAPQRTTLELFLLTNYHVPLTEAPFSSIRYSLGTGALSCSYKGENAAQVASTCRFETGFSGTSCQIEGAIPIEDSEAAGAKSDIAWRMNAILFESKEAKVSTPLCRWGYPDETSVLHGAVLKLK